MSHQFSPKALPEKPAEQPIYNFSTNETNQETKILAFSGKIGAGKSTSAKYLHSLAFMYGIGLTPHSFVDEEGKLFVQTSEDEYREVFLDNKDPEVIEFLKEYVWPFMKKYSCADPLKKLCHDLFGIDMKLMYGTQEDKKTLTTLRWEDMPTKVGIPVTLTKEDAEEKNKKKPSVVYHTGFMTVRDVLEYVGSEIFRKMHPNCWAEALVRTIQQEKSAFAIIDDVRFPNEVLALQAVGGKVIRLTLADEEGKTSTHVSNISLDGFDGFDAVIDNSSMTMEDYFRELIGLLLEWGYFKVVNQ